MAEDIPRTTILILIILTIVISVLGTWTVINSSKVTAGQGTLKVSTLQTQGTASLTIVGPPQTSTDSGTASLTISNKTT